MIKLNPIERSEYINRRYKEYLRSSFQFGSNELTKLFNDRLEKEDLFKGPYVDLSLPFERGKNIKELIDEGVVCPSFSKLGDIDFTRPLYYHQEEAIRRINSGRSAVITTGTGSGKTESFLYPILNHILKEIEKGNNDVGIRAVFLYPMNALVNDQIERIRKILKTCPDIKFGFFTGETEEKVRTDYREKEGERNNTFIPKNELVSREEIRNTPPHLLFTNYSMLEYLLIRPNDYAIFTPERLKNWKFVVLDEAHTYYGSLGIEISMLMRRLTGFAPEKPRFILTSATLGNKGESEDDIVRFARNLTSADFDTNDIIFSRRIPFPAENLKYRIANSDYTSLKDNLKNKDEIRRISQKYKKIEADNVNTYLYELLSGDYNVYDLYTLLSSKSRSINDIKVNMRPEITEQQLTSLIDIINSAEKDGIGLFDLRYHSFVRPLAGAFTTIGKKLQLSLSKTNYINGYKAFETGNCRFCGSSYIIGRIFHNNENHLDYLYQNDEIDIYENYGSNELIKLDYFLLKNAVNEDEVESSVLEECVLCSKCGCIYSAKNLNADKCSCGDEYKTIVYKVKQSRNTDEEAYNNINQCPCCGHKSKSGVVRSLNVGKDEGTALIAQILYEAIDEEETVETKPKSLTLKLRTENKKIEKAPSVKQFLCFSDSRQQASFAAAFFDSNNTRMIQKRLIWKVFEDHSFNDITVDEMAAYLTEEIKLNKLFDNKLSAHKKSWITIMTDLLKVDGSYDGEGLGLYYFDLDLSDIDSLLPEENVKEVFGNYGITKSDLLTIMKVVLDVFKITPAINYTVSALMPEEKLEFLEYRRFDNAVMLQCSRQTQGIRSFLPLNESNMVSRYICKVCGCDEKKAKEILEIIFTLAIDISEDNSGQKLFVKQDSKEAYQINVSRYIVKSYKKHKFYRCSKCGRLTPYNVHNICVQDKCDGILTEVDPDEVLAMNFYRNQYKTKKIENIVIKEHTAQLNKNTAREYQRDFVNKKINILSCSTTFEMGIDIGALETVFMRNVPPTPANYVQRAGRAGRRKDSSAYILTYCGTSSHDYTYFNEPEKMISGVIRPPYFDVLNKKIIVRHLIAASLGFFFREYPDYFRTIEKLVFDGGIEAFNEYVCSHPKVLNDYINKKVLPEALYSEYHDFQWFDAMNGNDEKLQSFAEDITRLAQEYTSAKDQALQEENYAVADYCSNSIRNLKNTKTIDALSKYCVIPKYGFPVDVVELQVYDKGIKDNKYEASRDMRIAISEYAPDSEVVIDKKKFTSKYITLPRISKFPRHYFCECPECKGINLYVSNTGAKECKFCGASITSQPIEYFIEPVYGFKTGITKESTHMKPKRSYAGEVLYIGGGVKKETHMEIGNTIIAETSTDDELLVMNKSGFYMCPVCGYSDIFKKKNFTPQAIKKHKNPGQYDCPNETLEYVRLGHCFRTDVTRITIPILSLEYQSQALSFMYALLEGISNALQIERNDIDGILEPNMDKNCYDILIYDDVPGGAGHVKRLMDKTSFVAVLKSALNKVSQECCDENTSCYSCLRNYRNQSYHSRLKRKYAKDIIEAILTEIKTND